MNYRGLQLTSQLSKAMERYIGVHFLGRLSFFCFGNTQVAYRKRHGARDGILYVVLVWLQALALSYKIALYCSDVSGAFDHVRSQRLIKKL